MPDTHPKKTIRELTPRGDTLLQNKDLVELDDDSTLGEFKTTVGDIRREVTRTQTAHGFATGDQINYEPTGDTYRNADASLGRRSDATALVIDVDNFVPVTSGVIHAAGHLKAKGVHWLGDAGATVIVQPVSSSFTQQVLLVIDDDRLVVHREWSSLDLGLGHRRLRVFNSTTDATPTALFEDGSSLQIAVPLDTLVGLTATVMGRQSSGGADTLHWIIDGTVANVGGVVSLKGQPTRNTRIQADNVNWKVDFVASSPNVLIQVTGAAGTLIDWEANLKQTRVG